MRNLDFNNATDNLLNWTQREEWNPRLAQVHLQHFEALASAVDIDEQELEDALGEASGVLSAFILEDFFTARFGENGELNVIDDYLGRRGWRETDPARRYLEAVRDSRVSLYEVLDTDPGRSLTLRDLLLEREAVRVSEHLGSKAAVRWDRLAARIVEVDGTKYFTGALLSFRHEVTIEILSAFDELAREAKKDLKRALRRSARKRRGSLPPPPLSRRTILRNLPGAQVFTYFWLIDAVSRAQAPAPRLRNTDDEPMVFCQVRFPILAEPAEVSAALDRVEGFERDGDGAARWVWLAAGSPSRRLARRRAATTAAQRGEGSGTTVLGRVEIGDSRLLLSVNSSERAERGQSLLASCLGDLIGPALVSHQEPEQAMEEWMSRDRRDEPVDWPGEAVQAIRAYLDEHYRDTLDEPLAALGGQSPRRAAATKKGRDRVIEWLKQLENTERRRAAAQGHAPYDTDWIWQELGIDPPR